MKLKEVTKDNYYSWTGHLSNSFMKSFKDCQFAAIQKYIHEAKDEQKQCFAEGHIVESYITNGPDDWEKDVERYLPVMKGKTGKFYKWVTDLFVAGERVRNDPFVMSFIDQPGNEFQKIYTFEIGGVMWKAALDVMNEKQKWFADIKTTAKHFFDEFWVKDPLTGKNKKVKFIDAFNYWQQMAVYAEACRQNVGEECTPYLIPVTKTNPADCVVFDMRSNRYEEIISEMEILAPYAMKVIEGEIEPTKCGECSHCLKARVNTKAIDANKFCNFEKVI